MLSLIKAEFQKRCFKLSVLIPWGMILLLSTILVRESSNISDMYADVFLKFTGMSPFIGIVIFTMFSGAYIQEYESKMNSLINSTKLGKKKTSMAKWIAHGIMAAIINISVFFVVFHKAYSAANGKGLDLQLTKLWYFANSGSTLTVLQLTLIVCLTIILGSFFFAQIGLTLSSISKSAVLPFILGGVIMGLPTFLNIILVSMGIPSKTIAHIGGFFPLNVMYYGEQIRNGMPFIVTLINGALFLVAMIVLPKITYKAFIDPNKK